MPSSIKIKDIRIDGGTQSRTKLNERHLNHLLEVLDYEGRLEPVEVIYDGVDYWLWDGFHRVETYRRAKRSSIPAHITQGTQRDAILKSCGANGKHGLPRCNADKRRAVVRLLIDDEWGAWPDSQLARTAGVSREYVVRLRAELIAKGELSCDRSQDKQVVRGGTTYTMDTTNIGKTEPAADEPEPQEPADANRALWARRIDPRAFYRVNVETRVVHAKPYRTPDEAWRNIQQDGIGWMQVAGGTILLGTERYWNYRFVDSSEPNPVPTSQPPQPSPAPQPADPPKDWIDTLIIGKHYPVDRKRGHVINEPFDSDQDCRAAYPGLRPEMTAHLRNNKTFFSMYRFITPEPASVGDSVLAVLPDSRIVDLSTGEIISDAPEGQAIHADSLDDSTSPDVPTAPRHDPRAVSNTGEWTPNETAYMNRAQAVVNHAHPGKMPFVGNPIDEVARLKARIAELESENARLVAENIRLRAEIVGLRVQVQPSDGMSKPAERMTQ